MIPLNLQLASADQTYAMISRAYANHFRALKHINDSRTTAPSKRVIGLYPGYERQKKLLGILAALEVGLDRIRVECRLFDVWPLQT